MERMFVDSLGVLNANNHIALSGDFRNQVGSNRELVSSDGEQLGCYLVERRGADHSSVDSGFSRSSAGVIEVNNGTVGTLRDLRLRSINPAGSATAFWYELSQ